MARVRKSYMIAAGTLAVLGALWGCNGSQIDDEEFSDSVLVVDSVEPASIQADVSPDTDPNSGFVSPPDDDKVTVSVRNLNRTQSGSGIFGDIQITSFDLACDDTTLAGLVNSTGNAASLTIPAESSAGISVLLLPGAFKQANAGTLLGVKSSRCRITFNGQDLSGEPILSQEAVVSVSFVDTP